MLFVKTTVAKKKKREKKKIITVDAKGRLFIGGWFEVRRKLRFALGGC